MAALLTTEPITAAVVLAVPGPATEPPLVVGDHRSVVLDNLGGPSGAQLLARIAADIGPAVEAVEAFWGTDWSHQVEVTATGSDQQFATLAGAGGGAGDTAQWADVAAVAVADRVDPERRRVTGQRVVFAPGAATMSDTALRIVLTHELFHYAARADTAVGAPRWLTEGVADFVARSDQEPPPASPATPLLLPSDQDLDAPGPQRAEAYDRAWGFARYVAARFGTDKLRELYLSACGPAEIAPAVAVPLVLGIDLPDLLTGWQQWQG